MRYVLAVAVVILMFFSVVFYGELTEETAFTAPSALEEVRDTAPTVHQAISRNIDTLIHDGGVAGALDVVAHAFAEHDVDINECHALNHLVGHYAPRYYDDDFDALVEHATYFCARGYVHGAEAQIALEGGNYVVRMHALCDAQRKKDDAMSCFHGAGHAFLNKTRDINRALALCDTLKRGDDVDRASLPDCYEGAFSEVTNLVGGFDGETGLPFEGPPPMQIEGTPLAFCASFEKQYQVACALELSGLGMTPLTTPTEAGELMRSCITDAAHDALMRACLYNITASYVRYELNGSPTVTYQHWMSDQQKEIRIVYLVAAGQEMAQSVRGGQDVDTDTFCESFPFEDEVALCKRQVESYNWLVQIFEKY